MVDMSWSKVKNRREKPLGWWYHKIMCEFGYWLSERYFIFKAQREYRNLKGMRMYYNHLNIMCDKYGFNLYGEKWQSKTNQ